MSLEQPLMMVISQGAYRLLVVTALLGIFTEFGVAVLNLLYDDNILVKLKQWIHFKETALNQNKVNYVGIILGNFR